MHRHKEQEQERPEDSGGAAGQQEQTIVTVTSDEETKGIFVSRPTRYLVGWYTQILILIVGTPGNQQP